MRLHAIYLIHNVTTLQALVANKNEVFQNVTLIKLLPFELMNICGGLRVVTMLRY